MNPLDRKTIGTELQFSLSPNAALASIPISTYLWFTLMHCVFEVNMVAINSNVFENSTHYFCYFLNPGCFVK